MSIETRTIKFYLNESVNKIKKEKILDFLTECQTVENKLLEYYWNNYDNVIKNKAWMDFYKNRHMITEPRLKFHHYMHVLKQVYEQLKSIETRIYNKINFYFKDDKEKQRIYNYCKGFCFEWGKLEKYISKQLKEYKNKDIEYYNFLSLVQNYITDVNKYSQLKQDIEEKFWYTKSKINQPYKKEFQIRCNTAHTVDINKLNYYQWIFIIDNNDIIGGTNKKPVFDKMYIPVKISDFHMKKLQSKILGNTFNLKLNKYGKIEIIGNYKIEVNKLEINIKDKIGIDIGLKNLITSSDGEIIEQNSKILTTTKRLLIKQKNRDNMQAHLRKLYDDEQYLLPDKNYNNFQYKLNNFVKCDNRYKIKHFLKSRISTEIIMEDLNISSSATYSKEVNSLLKKMHIQQIKNDIMKYSKELGLKVTLVNPAFTSQQCPICGYVSKENRKTQEKFCCVKCNHTDNADHNASINIMNRLNETRIKLNTPLWRVKEILNIS